MEYLVEKFLTFIHKTLKGRKAVIGLIVMADHLPDGTSGITAVNYTNEPDNQLEWLAKASLVQLKQDNQVEKSSEVMRALNIRKQQIECYIAENEVVVYDQDHMHTIMQGLEKIEKSATVILSWYDEVGHQFRFRHNIPSEFEIYSVASGLIDHMAGTPSDIKSDVYL